MVNRKVKRRRGLKFNIKKAVKIGILKHGDLIQLKDTKSNSISIMCKVSKHGYVRSILPAKFKYYSIHSWIKTYLGQNRAKFCKATLLRTNTPMNKITLKYYKKLNSL